MLHKFIKLLFIVGILFIKSAYSSDYSEADCSLESKKHYNSSNAFGMSDDLENEDYHHRNVRYLIDSFYKYYDLYKKELDQQKIHFFENNYLDIIEDNFEYFTESKMTQWVADYFDRRLKSPLAAMKEFNIYDPIYSVVAIFSEAVSSSDECEYPSSDDEETLSEDEKRQIGFHSLKGWIQLSGNYLKNQKQDSLMSLIKAFKQNQRLLV